MKTKLISLFLALIVSIGTIFANGTLIGNMYYYLKSNWTAQVTYQYLWDPDNYAGMTYARIPIYVLDNDGHYYYVTSIGESAFHDCTSMTCASMEYSRVSEIESEAFDRCSNLESVSLSDSLTFIGYAAFRGCASLKSIKIPARVSYIGYEAFSGCSSLTKIVCKAPTPPSCGDNTFDDVNKSIPLYVPANSIEAYKSADYWKEFVNIYPFIYAEDVYETEVTATPHEDNSVTITWPNDWDATIYIIEIKKDGEVVRELEFDADGMLLSNNKNAIPVRNTKMRRVTSNATMNNNGGWQYEVKGLEEGTEYTYTITAKKADDTEVFTQTITFSTLSHEGIENIEANGDNTTKILHNGQIYILRGDKTYTLQGQEVE